MSYSSKKYQEKVADCDLLVYKVLKIVKSPARFLRKPKIKLESPFQDYIYEEGRESPYVKLSPVLNRNSICFGDTIDEGYHAYTNIDDVDCYIGFEECGVFEFIIPKGTPYYVSYNGSEIAASTIYLKSKKPVRKLN